MIPTRRDFMEAVSGTAALAVERRASATQVSGPRFFVASLTPLDRSGNLDEPLLRDLLAFFRAQGVDGVLALGSTGEFSAFSVQERKKILERFMRGKDNLQVMCQVGTPNLPETLDLLHHAAASGADLGLVLPPFYVKNPPVEGLARFFGSVLEAARIPVLLYNYPAMSGITITHDLVHKLEHYDRLYGIKDSTGKLDSTTAFIHEFPKLKIFCGNSAILEPVLKLGAAGAITANGNVVARQTSAVMRAYREGRDTSALQAKLSEAGALAGPFSSIPGMKYALGQMGLRESFCRPPLVEIAETQKEQLRARIEKLKAEAS